MFAYVKKLTAWAGNFGIILSIQVKHRRFVCVALPAFKPAAS